MHRHAACTAAADGRAGTALFASHRAGARPLPGIGYTADPAASSEVPVYAAPDGDTSADYTSTLTTASTPDSILRTVGSGASATVFAIPTADEALNTDHYASTLTTASTTGGGGVDYSSVLTSATRDASADYTSQLTTAASEGVGYSVLTEAPVR